MNLIHILLIILSIYLIYLYCQQTEEFTPVEVLSNYKDIKSTLDLFRKVVVFLKENQIEYWMIGGTLLGTIRDKGMIPWDDDVDISVVKKNIPKLLAQKDKLKKLNMGIAEWFGGYKIYDLNGKPIKGKDFLYPFVDIFVMIDGKNNDYIYEKPITRSYWDDHYFKNELFPLREYLFEDFYVYGPNDPIPFLHRTFPNWENIAMKTYDHVSHTRLKKVTFPVEYNKTSKPYLWTYSNNDSELIKLCHQSVTKHCSKSFNIIKLNDKNIIEYIPELKKLNLFRLSNESKSLLFSVMLLYKYGGLYLDPQIIVFKDLSDIILKLRRYHFVGFGNTNTNCKDFYGYPATYMMASRPNNILLGKTLVGLLKQINLMNINGINDSILKKELAELMQNQDFDYYHYDPKSDGTCDVYDNMINTQMLLSNEKIEYQNEDKMMVLVLSKTNLAYRLKNETIILDFDNNLGKFLRKALD